MFQLRDCAFTLAFSTSGGSFAIEGFSVFSSGRNVGGGSFSFARYDVSTSTCSCNCFANCERSDMIYRQSLFEYVLDLKIILWVGQEEAGMLGPFISEGYRRALSLITPHQSHHFYSSPHLAVSIASADHGVVMIRSPEPPRVRSCLGDRRIESPRSITTLVNTHLETVHAYGGTITEYDRRAALKLN